MQRACRMAHSVLLASRLFGGSTQWRTCLDISDALLCYAGIHLKRGFKDVTYYAIVSLCKAIGRKARTFCCIKLSGKDDAGGSML